MDFRILGPLEVRSAGAPLPLGGHKQRGILAVLLLNANRVVSTDRLIDDVWGDAAPRTVRASVQNCISRLRTLLGRELIEARPPGYVLRVDPDDIDAVRFARAVEAADSLQPPERVAALTEALALWRGAPLDEFAYEAFAQPDIARLDELRLEAVEVRLHAELEIGHHATVLSELEALAARHPARERLRYLQMVALYRAGRQRDALAAYQESRRELVERYGLEPGDELRALERMILAQDPALREPTPHGRAAEPAVQCSAFLVAEPTGDWAEEIVTRTGGVVRDRVHALVAVYGVPRPEDGDALRALRAAIELRAAQPAVRIAVTRLGRTTDAGAGRGLLEKAAPGQIVIGAELLPVVAHAVDVLADSGGTCRLLRMDPEAEALPRRLDTTFVARDGELDQLQAQLDSVVEEGTVRRLIVLGDAGIGKTRLAREFARRASALVVGTRCDPQGASDPLGDLLGQLDAPEHLLATDPDRERVTGALRTRTDAGRTEELWAMRRLLEATARSGPVVVVLDDLQWAPPSVFDLVDYLAGWSNAPLLVLGLARPEVLETRPSLEAHAWFLDPLSDADAGRLARELSPTSGLPPETGERVAATAEGNPLYVEQLVAWASEAHDERVPPTIDLLIAARVERLPALERHALERASVVGTEFWRGAVESASPDEERLHASAALMELVRRRLVHPGPSPVVGEDGFRFHHALIRDVVYAGLPRRDRARVHGVIAQSLGPEPALDAIAGHHLEQAAAVDHALAAEAARRLGAAGFRSLRQIDAVRAEDLLGRAAHLSADGARRRELEWGLGTAVKFSGSASRADEILEEVAVRAAAADDEPNVFRARVEQIWPRLARGLLGVEAAIRLLERAQPVFADLGDDFALARTWDITAAIDGVYLLQASRCERALAFARSHYERAGATTGPAEVRLAGAAYIGPRPVVDAIARCEQLLVTAETPVWASFVLPFLAVLHAMDGRFAQARDELEEARVGRAEFSDPGTLATSWASLAAEVELRAGDLERAEQVLVDACARLRDAGDSEWLAINTALLGDVQARKGRPAEALASTEAALSGVPSGHLTLLAVARRVRALALARLGKTREGVAVARKNEDALAGTDALVEHGRALAALAETLELDGDHAEAAVRRADAVTLLERKGDSVTAREVVAAR